MFNWCEVVNTPILTFDHHCSSALLDQYYTGGCYIVYRPLYHRIESSYFIALGGGLKFTHKASMLVNPFVIIYLSHF